MIIFEEGEQTVRRADARISLEHLRRRTRLPGAVRTEQGQIAPYEFTNDRTCGTTHLINNPKNETSLHYCIVRFRERICFCPGKREPGCAEPHRTGAL